MGSGRSSGVNLNQGGRGAIGSGVAAHPLRWPDGLDLSALRYLVAAEEAGKFGQAAKIMGVRTSTVSRNVAKTEDALGVTLFERGHFGVRLTAAGKAIMVQVRRALADLDAISVAGWSRGAGQVGEIHLAIRMAPIGSLYEGLLNAWKNQYPQIEVTLHEMNDRDLMLALLERRIDLAMVPTYILWPQVVAELIGREPILVAMSKSHRLGAFQLVNWADLRDEVLLVQGWDTNQPERELYASLLGGGVRFKSHPVGKHGLLALVAAEFGVTLVSASQAGTQFPNVMYRPISESNAQVEIALAWAPQNEEAVVGRFVAFMRDRARLMRFF